MKKTILISLVLFCALLLVACGKKSENVLENNSSDILSSDTATIIDCQAVIQKYLENSNKDGQWEEIKVWDNIVVDYIWRLEDGTVFDTSIQSIAEACGKYTEWRDYTSWLSFEVWAWQMIKWFDNWVIWMNVWQTKTVKFWPDEWYWQRSSEYMISYTKDEIGDFSVYNIWDYFQPNPFAYGIITNITDKEMVVDFNHELAWKDLIFDITIKSIN